MQMKRGCTVPDLNVICEQYQATEFGYIANVGVDKIEAVILQFIMMQSVPLFFILELPTKQTDEAALRKDEYSHFHKDVYYIDGLKPLRALEILKRFGELLINDGLCSFGFGVKDFSSEIMLGKYNVVTLYAKFPDSYNEFFDRFGIARVKQLTTAWDTFSQERYGESFMIEVNGQNVYDILPELQKMGLYFAERRED